MFAAEAARSRRRLPACTSPRICRGSGAAKDIGLERVTLHVGRRHVPAGDGRDAPKAIVMHSESGRLDAATRSG